MPHEESKYSPETFKVLLKKLVQQPEEFTPEDCAECFEHLCAEAAAEAQASPTYSPAVWGADLYAGRCIPHCPHSLWSRGISRDRRCLRFGSTSARAARSRPGEGYFLIGGRNPLRGSMGLPPYRQLRRWLHWLRRYSRDWWGRPRHLQRLNDRGCSRRRSRRTSRKARLESRYIVVGLRRHPHESRMSTSFPRRAYTCFLASLAFPLPLRAALPPCPRAHCAHPTLAQLSHDFQCPWPADQPC